ncbi:unnamed protein product [Polarella glacialis]|nr:unnamed protein product [Polarella glacialis]
MEACHAEVFDVESLSKKRANNLKSQMSQAHTKFLRNLSEVVPELQELQNQHRRQRPPKNRTAQQGENGQGGEEESGPAGEDESGSTRSQSEEGPQQRRSEAQQQQQQEQEQQQQQEQQQRQQPSEPDAEEVEQRASETSEALDAATPTAKQPKIIVNAAKLPDEQAYQYWHRTTCGHENREYCAPDWKWNSKDWEGSQLSEWKGAKTCALPENSRRGPEDLTEEQGPAVRHPRGLGPGKRSLSASDRVTLQACLCALASEPELDLTDCIDMSRRVAEILSSADLQLGSDLDLLAQAKGTAAAVVTRADGHPEHLPCALVALSQVAELEFLDMSMKSLGFSRRAEDLLAGPPRFSRRAEVLAIMDTWHEMLKTGVPCESLPSLVDSTMALMEWYTVASSCLSLGILAQHATLCSSSRCSRCQAQVLRVRGKLYEVAEVHVQDKEVCEASIWELRKLHKQNVLGLDTSKSGEGRQLDDCGPKFGAVRVLQSFEEQDGADENLNWSLEKQAAKLYARTHSVAEIVAQFGSRATTDPGPLLAAFQEVTDNLWEPLEFLTSWVLWNHAIQSPTGENADWSYAVATLTKVLKQRTVIQDELLHCIFEWLEDETRLREQQKKFIVVGMFFGEEVILQWLRKVTVLPPVAKEGQQQQQQQQQECDMLPSWPATAATRALADLCRLRTDFERSVRCESYKVLLDMQIPEGMKAVVDVFGSLADERIPHDTKGDDSFATLLTEAAKKIVEVCRRFPAEKYAQEHPSFILESLTSLTAISGHRECDLRQHSEEIREFSSQVVQDWSEQAQAVKCAEALMLRLPGQDNSSDLTWHLS